MIHLAQFAFANCLHTVLDGEYLPKDLSVGIFSTVFLLQLTVAVTSCYLWVINIQNYLGKSNLPSLLEWLQMWDGIEGRMSRTMYRNLSSRNWFARKAFLQITTIAEWCVENYTSCLVICFVSQVVVIVMIRTKWLAGTFINCSLWFVLLAHSGRKAPRFRLSDVLLCGFACGISLYLFIMCSVGDRIFGQIMKKRKKKLESRKSRSDGQNKERKSPNNDAFTNKLKLPEELMFADEKYSLHDNIGCLSLGPPGNDTKPRETTGSWFWSNLYPETGKTHVVREAQSPKTNSLIWPAKFHLNGLSVKSRKNGNGLCDAKNQNTFQAEFSDEEFCSFSDTDRGKVKKTIKLKNSIRRDINDTITKHSSCNKRCNALQFILLCSLALNVWLIWLLRNSIRKMIFGT